MKLTPQAVDEKADASLGRMSIDKRFHGDLEGTSKGEMLSASTSVKGSGAYVAIERVLRSRPYPRNAPQGCQRDDFENSLSTRRGGQLDLNLDGLYDIVSWDELVIFVCHTAKNSTDKTSQSLERGGYTTQNKLDKSRWNLRWEM